MSNQQHLSYTWRLTRDQADQLDRLAVDVRNRAGRNRLDRSEMLAALLGFLEDNPSVAADLANRIQPEAMVRKTYYIAEEAADAMDAAVERLQKSTNDLIPKHRILGAVLAHGVANTEAIESELRNGLITDLGGDE